MKCQLIVAATLLLAFGAANPAHAVVSHEQAFNLCVAQPELQTDEVRAIYDDIMSKPHPPQLDDLSAEKVINALQYDEATKCAGQMMAHPDVFATVALTEPTTSDGWKIAWVAFNTTCKSTLTAKCISGEVDGAAAVREMNSNGLTPASRDCQLVLDQPMDFASWRQCMDVVGDRHAEEATIQSCPSTIGWHSQKDGKTAGRKVLACFNRAK